MLTERTGPALVDEVRTLLDSSPTGSGQLVASKVILSVSKSELVVNVIEGDGKEEVGGGVGHE